LSDYDAKDQIIREFRRRNFQGLLASNVYGMFRNAYTCAGHRDDDGSSSGPWMKERWHGAIFAQRKRVSHVTHALHAHVPPFPRGPLDFSFFAPSHPFLALMVPYPSPYSVNVREKSSLVWQSHVQRGRRAMHRSVEKDASGVYADLRDEDGVSRYFYSVTVG